MDRTRSEWKINSAAKMTHLPDSFWLRSMIEALLIMIKEAEPSGLMTHDMGTVARNIWQYLEQYDKSGASFSSDRPISSAPRSGPSPAPHGQDKENSNGS